MEEEVWSLPSCPYGNGHADLLVWANEYVEDNRRRIGLEEPWSIRVRIVCPLPTTNKKVGYEGKITWDSEVWYATIDLLCTLPGLLYEWVLVHELFELKHWRTGDAFSQLAEHLSLLKRRAFFNQRYSAARNQEIELEVGQFLSSRRPAHMMGGEPFPSEGRQRPDLAELLRRWREESDSEEDDEENPYPDILTVTINNDEEK